MHRRSLLVQAATVLGGAAGGVTLAHCGSSPSDGGGPSPGPDVPGSQGLAAPLSRIGLQLYTVRSLMQEDVRATLQLVRDIGYTEVEFASTYGVAPAELRGWLDELGLTAPSGHLDLNGFETDLSAALERAATLGHQYLVLPWIPEERRTPEGYAGIATLLNAAASQAQDLGITVAYHNHDFDHVPFPGTNTTPYDQLLLELDPDLVTLELDTYWAALAGLDPSLPLVQNPGRFRMLHVKDIGEFLGFSDVGAGTLNWDLLLPDAAAAGVTHYFVEHDEPGDPEASIRASFRYLSGT